MSTPRGDKHVLILGCGYTGVVLAQRLAFAGRPVVGTTRSERRASIIRTRGAHPILWDGADFAPLEPWRGRVHAVVHSIPPEVHPDGRDPTPMLLERFADWGLQAFIYLSSTSVWGDHGGAVVDETTPTAPDSPRGAARLAIEDRILAGPLPAQVIRPAGIYGPDRSQLHRIASGRYRVVDGGASYTNRVHVTDLAALIEAAIDRGRPGAVHLASDLEPATQRAVVDHVVATFGLPAPPEMSLAEARIRLDRNVLAMIVGSKRLDPRRTLDALGVRLRSPTYREGLADIWRRQRGEIEALIGC